MAWPPPVNPGDEILATQYNALLQCMQSWCGDVNGNGNKLTNAALSAVQQTTTVTGNFQIPSGGYGPHFIVVNATNGTLTVSLPGNPIDGETYTFMRVDGTQQNQVWISAGQNIVYIYAGSVVNTYYVFPVSAVTLTWVAAMNRWDVTNVLPSMWIIWFPSFTAIDNTDTQVAQVQVNQTFVSNWLARRGEATVQWNGNLTLNPTSASPPIYITWQLPVRTALFMQAGAVGTGQMEQNYGGATTGYQTADIEAYGWDLTVGSRPHAPLQTSVQIQIAFSISYPIDY